MTPRLPQTAKTCVLVVEDEPRMRELLLRAIGSWGFNVVIANTGEEALRQMEGNLCHIVLLDLNLPAMSGLECFEAIRARWPKTQVVILTGFGDLESAKRAIHLDVVEFLTKPTPLGELEAALERAQRRLAPPDSLPVVEEEAPALPPEPGEASTLDEVERQHILAALARHSGNRAATAQELGISLRTLYYRLSEYQKQGYEVE